MQQFTIRTRLLMLVGAMFISFITIELMGFSALQRGLANLNTVYLDRVIPLRDLKTIADLYAVKIVDSSHKARSGRMTYAQAEDEVKEAERQIDTLWPAYQKTQMIDEEQRSVDALAKLVDAAQEPIERLKGILERGDKAALDTFVENEMYPLIDPLSEGLSHLTQIQVEESKRVYDASLVLYDSSSRQCLVRCSSQFRAVSHPAHARCLCLAKASRTDTGACNLLGNNVVSIE